MMSVEFRRHARKRREGKGLGDQDRALARSVAEHLGCTYSAYYLSPRKRCRETLEAMGFPVYNERRAFGPLPSKFDRFDSGLTRPTSDRGGPYIEGYLAVPEARKMLLRQGEKILDEARKIAFKLMPGHSALIVCHKLEIELVAMTARGDENPAWMGGDIRPLEGVALDFDGETVSVRPLRLPTALVEPAMPGDLELPPGGKDDRLEGHGSRAVTVAMGLSQTH